MVSVVYIAGVSGFRFANNVPINASKFAEMVNVLDYVETDKNGDHHTWCRVTDIELTEETVEAVKEGGVAGI